MLMVPLRRHSHVRERKQSTGVKSQKSVHWSVCRVINDMALEYHASKPWARDDEIAKDVETMLKRYVPDADNLDADVDKDGKKDGHVERK